MITIGPLAATDRAAWEELFRGYIAFYGRTEPPSLYEHAWQRFQSDTDMHAQASNLTARRLYDQLAEHRGFIRYEVDL
jgi:hypothetical protein